MILNDKEHYDLIAAFERAHSGRFDKEHKDLWRRGIIYQDGCVNELFLAYRRGYAYAEADMRADIQNVEASRDGYRDDARVLHDALVRMIAIHEHEFDYEEAPDWMKDALMRTNAKE